MEFKVGDLCKHFKGSNLIEKNIYEIIAVNVKYTGEKVDDLSNLVVYKALFQEDKYFTREYEDLVKELSDDEKNKYHQDTRVQKLSDEEILLLSDPEFIKEKEAFIKSKY